MDLPYRAEYAKSGRASCRGCKSLIAKETLRLAVMVQTDMFDGKTPQWYHDHCFFVKQRPKTEDDIAHFESLRWEDQEAIRKNIGSGVSIVVPQKRDAETAANNMAALKDFVIEYSKSSRAECRGCQHTVMKEEVRISKKDYKSDVGKRYGGQDKWHHLTCFAKLRSKLGYFESGDKLPGFNTLKAEDKKEVKTQLPAIKQEDLNAKKPKVEDEVDGGESSLNEEIKSQNETMFGCRDKLKVLKKTELEHLLEFNNEDIPVGTERILDRLADVMTFGALERCKECKTGQFVFNKLGYICQGDLTEWTKCQQITKEPKRRSFKIPPELAEEYTFLKKYKYVPRTRVIKDVTPTVSQSLIKKEEDDAGTHGNCDTQADSINSSEISFELSDGDFRHREGFPSSSSTSFPIPPPPEVAPIPPPLEFVSSPTLPEFNPIPRSRPYKRKRLSKDEQVEKFMEAAMNRFSNIIKQIDESTEVADADVLFGQSVGLTLQGLPKIFKAQAKRKIMEILEKYEILNEV